MFDTVSGAQPACDDTSVRPSAARLVASLKRTSSTSQSINRPVLPGKGHRQGRRADPDEEIGDHAPWAVQLLNEVPGLDERQLPALGLEALLLLRVEYEVVDLAWRLQRPLGESSKGRHPTITHPPLILLWPCFG